jgi:hypothetical protein
MYIYLLYLLDYSILLNRARYWLVEFHAEIGAIKEAHCLIAIKARPHVAQQCANNIMLCNRRQVEIFYLLLVVQKRPVPVDVGKSPFKRFTNARHECVPQGFTGSRGWMYTSTKNMCRLWVLKVCIRSKNMILSFILFICSGHQVAKFLQQSTLHHHVRIMSVPIDCTKHTSN